MSPEGMERGKEKRASGRWLQGMDVQARCGQPGPTQRRSPHAQALAPLWCAVSQVVKTAQSRGRTERTLLSPQAPRGAPGMLRTGLIRHF